MRALTVRQPWAWAIFNAGKDVENRGWYPQCLEPGETIAIHVALKRADDYAMACRLIESRAEPIDDRPRVVPAGVSDPELAGYVIGLVDVIGWDRDYGRSVWTHPDCRHWHLDSPRLIVPVPATGALGLWEIDRSELQAVAS